MVMVLRGIISNYDVSISIHEAISADKKNKKL